MVLGGITSRPALDIDTSSNRPKSLMDAERHHAAGQIMKALPLLSDYIRDVLELSVANVALCNLVCGATSIRGEGEDPGGGDQGKQDLAAVTPTTGGSHPSLEHLLEAYVLRGKIHMRIAHDALTTKASLSESSPQFGHDPTVELELAIADATEAIKLLKTCHAAHILRVEAAALGQFSQQRLQNMILESLSIFPDDEQLQHLADEYFPKKDKNKNNKDISLKTNNETTINEKEDEEDDDVPLELQCPLCLKLFLDPVTTPCGHTFCRHCLVSALDYAQEHGTDGGTPFAGAAVPKQQCPLCRAPLHMTPVDHPTTLVVKNLIEGLYSEQLKRRQEEHRDAGRRQKRIDKNTVNDETPSLSPTITVPLFVLSPVFPGHAMPLQIFEPRYRLMMRRVLQGSMRFGMVAESQQQQQSSGDAEVAPLTMVGTMLKVVESRAMPDGRLLVNTVAVSRFVIQDHWECDGYRVGAVRELHDDPLPPQPSQPPTAIARSESRPAEEATNNDNNSTSTLCSVEEMLKILNTIMAVVKARTNQELPVAFSSTQGGSSSVTRMNMEAASLWLAPFFIKDRPVTVGGWMRRTSVGGTQSEVLAALSTTSTTRRVARIKDVAVTMGLL